MLGEVSLSSCHPQNASNYKVGALSPTRPLQTTGNRCRYSPTVSKSEESKGEIDYGLEGRWACFTLLMLQDFLFLLLHLLRNSKGAPKSMRVPGINRTKQCTGQSGA